MNYYQNLHHFLGISNNETLYIYIHFLILYLFEESLVTTVCLPHYRTFENELLFGI